MWKRKLVKYSTPDWILWGVLTTWPFWLVVALSEGSELKLSLDCQPNKPCLFFSVQDDARDIVYYLILVCFLISWSTAFLKLVKSFRFILVSFGIFVCLIRVDMAIRNGETLFPTFETTLVLTLAYLLALFLSQNLKPWKYVVLAVILFFGIVPNIGAAAYNGGAELISQLIDTIHHNAPAWRDVFSR